MSCATEFFSRTGVTKYLRDMKAASDKKLIAERHRFSLRGWPLFIGAKVDSIALYVAI